MSLVRKVESELFRDRTIPKGPISINVDRGIVVERVTRLRSSKRSRRMMVRPTRSELVNYTIVVIVFVTFVMALVASVDFGFTKLVLWVFGG